MGKILFIRGGAIGDFILTLPAIRLVVENLPQAEIEIMGYESIISLAQAAGYAKRIRSIEYGAMARFFVPNADLDKELSAYFASFSVVVSYLYDPDEFFKGNLERAGVQTLLECSHRVDNEGGPAAEQLAKPLEALALFLDEGCVAPKLAFGAAEREVAEAFLTSALVERTLIGVHPGSGSPYKNWDLGNWLEVMVALSKENPNVHFIVATGEAEEEKVSEFLADVARAKLPFSHAKGMPLTVLGEVLSRCRLFLGHDSGISHLAGAVGTPCQVLFGPTMSAVWAPQNPGVEVIEHPSGLLSEISVEEVVSKALARL